jgi:hypothetical protein
VAQKISIDGVEYDAAQMSDEAKATLNSIMAVDAELRRIQALGAALKTAKSAYIQALKNQLANDAK